MKRPKYEKMRNNGFSHYHLKPPRRFSSSSSTPWRFKFYKIIAIALGVTLLSYYIILSRLSHQQQRQLQLQQQLLQHQQNMLAEDTSSDFYRGRLIDGQLKCKLPNLPVDNPEIMKYIKPVGRIQCKLFNGLTIEDWVVVNGSHAMVTKSAKEKYGPKIKCKFQDIDRIHDSLSRLSSRGEVEGEVFEFKHSNFVRVTCTSSSHQMWKSYLAGIGRSLVVPKVTAHTSNVPLLNVLMWGHDSVSRNMFIRKLPMTFAYLTEKLNGVILKGYNIVGDGTPQALIPILTGKTELELPEARKRKGSSAHYVNVYPFVWDEYKTQGYLTAYLEDAPTIATFNFRLKGFKDAPTDWYMRPYFLAAEPHYADYPQYCIGGTPRHKIMMNYVKHILEFRKDKPKFIFSLHSELSHGDVNAVEGVDADLKKFVEEDLKENGALNNTIVIIYSDHGSRFSNIRESQQGKQEERMPIFIFIFPTWFKTKYKVAYDNFVQNSEILSTPFDIHATLQDILKMSIGEVHEDYFRQPNKKEDRQMSLFRPVPPDRTCSDAGIEPHWCACLQWHLLNVSSAIVQKAAVEFVNYVNIFMENQTSVCARLKLNRVLWAANLLPSEELLHFKQNSDNDGFIPDMTDQMAVRHSTLQLKLETVPGLGMFEVSMSHNLADRTFHIQESEISRINRYGSQALCVEHSLEHLRKFCYCKTSGEEEVDSSPNSSAMQTPPDL